MKYVVAMFQHETNTFSSLKTPLEAFAKPAGFTDTAIVGRDPEIAATRPPNLKRMALNIFGMP